MTPASTQKLFVWDFHGTLEKGNEQAALEISNEVLASRGYVQRFSQQDAVDLYGKKWYEYFAYLLPEQPHEVHLELQETCFEWPAAEAIVAKHMQPNDHAHQVLSAIQSAGHRQILLSNTSQRALPIFVKLAKMTDIFNTTNAFAIQGHGRDATRTKAHVLDDYVAHLSKPLQLIVIGDSASDMALAQKEQAIGYWYRHSELPPAISTEQHIIPINDLRKVLARI